MNADLILQPIEEIRAAVENLVAGLERGEVFTADLWDTSVSTLARSHDQIGGDTRRLVYEVFRGCSDEGDRSPVVGHLEGLRRRLRPG